MNVNQSLIRKGIVGGEHLPAAPPLAEDLLVALGAPDVLRVRLNEVRRDEAAGELEQAEVAPAEEKPLQETIKEPHWQTGHGAILKDRS